MNSSEKLINTEKYTDAEIIKILRVSSCRPRGPKFEDFFAPKEERPKMTRMCGTHGVHMDNEKYCYWATGQAFYARRGLLLVLGYTPSDLLFSDYLEAIEIYNRFNKKAKARLEADGRLTELEAEATKWINA